MAAFAVIAERRIVNLCMAGNAGGTDARWRDVALIVAGFALGLGVTRRKAQPWVVRPDVCDFSPVGLVVARGALGACKPAFVWVGVARDAVALEPEEGRVASSVLLVVAVLACNGPVSTSEGPARHAMVEALFLATGPTNEPRIPTKVLNMAFSAGLVAILPPVKPSSVSNTGSEIVVARQAGIGVDSPPSRVTFAAVGVSVDVGVGVGKLTRREKLSAAGPRHQRSADRGADSYRRQERQCSGPPFHCEKIQR